MGRLICGLILLCGTEVRERKINNEKIRYEFAIDKEKMTYISHEKSVIMVEILQSNDRKIR